MKGLKAQQVVEVSLGEFETTKILTQLRTQVKKVEVSLGKFETIKVLDGAEVSESEAQDWLRNQGFWSVDDEDGTEKLQLPSLPDRLRRETRELEHRAQHGDVGDPQDESHARLIVEKLVTIEAKTYVKADDEADTDDGSLLLLETVEMDVEGTVLKRTLANGEVHKGEFTKVRADRRNLKEGEKAGIDGSTKVRGDRRIDLREGVKPEKAGSSPFVELWSSPPVRPSGSPSSGTDSTVPDEELKSRDVSSNESRDESRDRPDHQDLLERRLLQFIEEEWMLREGTKIYPNGDEETGNEPDYHDTGDYSNDCSNDYSNSTPNSHSTP